MWAQIIKMRVKPGAEDRVAEVMDAIRAAEQPDSGLIRTLTMRDQADPASTYTMVVFESEEAARAREQDPRRAEGMEAARAVMGEVFEMPPEFVNLDVILENVNG